MSRNAIRRDRHNARRYTANEARAESQNPLVTLPPQFTRAPAPMVDADPRWEGLPDLDLHYGFRTHLQAWEADRAR